VSFQVSANPHFSRLTISVLLLAFCFVLFVPLAWPQHSHDMPGHDMSGMDDMPGMHHDTNAPEDPAVVAKRLADKCESEFNHHLAGALVALAGLFLLAEGLLAKHWSGVRYIWPMCFLAAGLFLLIFSDTDIWPFGSLSPWYALTHNAEDLQHKVFSVILLALGYVEIQRVRGRFTAAWTAWVFPVMSASGATLLLFHAHGGDMSAPHAMEVMERVQRQHAWFAATGFGIALTSGLAGTPSGLQRIFKWIWPLFLIALGVLLILYVE